VAAVFGRVEFVVPVRLGARVVAFVAEGGFVSPDCEAVPGEEDADVVDAAICGVHVEGDLDVGLGIWVLERKGEGYEVIVAAVDGFEVFCCFWGEFVEALDRFYVGLFFVGGEVAPVFCLLVQGL
jgi:hypothetical protein